MPIAHQRQGEDQRALALAAGAFLVAAAAAEVILIYGLASRLRHAVRLAAVRARLASQVLRHDVTNLLLIFRQEASILRFDYLRVGDSACCDLHCRSPVGFTCISQRWKPDPSRATPHARGSP